jgi:hypothetical protein
VRTTQIHLDLVGEAFWVKERNGLGLPVGFWPVPPHWVTDTPTVKRRSYHVSWSGWQGEIPDSEMLWLVDPDPANPYGRGSGIARTLTDELETDEYAARHTRMTFLNRARPDLIVWPEPTKNDAGTISEPAAQALAERWRNEHQGFWRAALPFFATRKIGVHEVSQSFQDLQLTELRKYERDMIVQVFGIMPEELGIVRDGALNRAALDSVDFLYKTNLIVPRIDFLCAYLQERVVPEYDERLVVGYQSPVQADRQFQLDSAKAAPYTMTVDEWRRLQGLEPLPDGAGAVFVMPANLVTSPSLMAAPPVLATGHPTVTRAATVEAELLTDLDAMTEAKDADGLAIVQRELDDNPDDLPELSRRVAKRETALRRWLTAQLAALSEDTPLDAFVRALEQGDEEAALAAVPWEAWATGLRPPLFGYLHEAFIIGVRQGAEDAGVRLVREAGQVPWNVVNPQAVLWAREYAGTLITNLTASTREGVLRVVRRVIVEALREGWSAYKTGRVLRQTIGLTAKAAEAVANYAMRLAHSAAGERLSDEAFFARVGRYTEALRRQRALLIARTELAFSSSQGQQRLWQIAVQRGQMSANAVERIWIVAPDGRLCEKCEALDHTTAPLFGAFKDGTTNPPRHPACRCAVGLRVKAARPRAAAGPETATVYVNGAVPNDALAVAAREGLAALARDLAAVEERILVRGRDVE